MKPKNCPICEELGIESEPRVGLFFGLYQVFAVCECQRCDNSIILNVGVEPGRPKFISKKKIDDKIEEAIREWNKRP